MLSSFPLSISLIQMSTLPDLDGLEDKLSAV